VFNLLQALIDACKAAMRQRQGKALNALKFPDIRVIIAGFPLPTLVLTPGWAIF
jgi:hypothetical protein